MEADREGTAPVARNRGFTLVEVTVLLAVVGVLVGLLASPIDDRLQRSRLARTRDDVEQIGRAVVSFYRDNGSFPRPQGVIEARPGTALLGGPISDAPPPGATPPAAAWTSSPLDLLSALPTRNRRGYESNDPDGRVGWAGGYLSSDIREDPWGHAYLINVFYLDPEGDLEDLDGTPLGAVYVLSAGPNGLVETPLYQPRARASVYGDDIGCRLQ